MTAALGLKQRDEKRMMETFRGYTADSRHFRESPIIAKLDDARICQDTIN
jgi:hypothetical protein